MVNIHFLENEAEAYGLLDQPDFSDIVAFPGNDGYAKTIIPCKKGKTRCVNPKKLTRSFFYFLNGCLNCDLYNVEVHFDIGDLLSEIFDETDISFA